VGTDFFTVEVLTLKGLVTRYVLFFIYLESRRVSLGGMTPYRGDATGIGSLSGNPPLMVAFRACCSTRNTASVDRHRRDWRTGR
jgi:hypothetical protein